MRFTRLTIGVLIIVVAVFVLAGEQLAGASANAVINARVTTVSSPISGTVSMQPRVLGSTVSRGDELASVTDSFVDAVRLDDLLLERDTARADLERLRTARQRQEPLLADLSDRLSAYREDRVAQLEAARAALASDAGQDNVAGRLGALAPEAVNQMLEIELRAARQGRFLGDGYNDAPFTEQMIVERGLRLAEMEAEEASIEERLTALERRIASERLRVNRLSASSLSSRVDGRLWEVLADDGETVQRGAGVARLVNCASAIVTLSVTEAVYNRLHIGAPAQFRVTGGGEVFEGTIARLAGSGAQTIYRNLAVAPSERHLERYDVAILVPGLRADPDLGCAIGRTGRVFFEARPLDFLRRFWN